MLGVVDVLHASGMGTSTGNGKVAPFLATWAAKRCRAALGWFSQSFLSLAFD